MVWGIQVGVERETSERAGLLSRGKIDINDFGQRLPSFLQRLTLLLSSFTEL